MVANGLFAMTEIAVVSAKRGRLRAMADEGDSRARAALALAESPGRFLSTVQVGITVVGTLAGVFSGASLAAGLEGWLVATGPGFFATHAHGTALGLVVVLISWLQLVVGELVPKRVALAHPETIACFSARPMGIISRVVGPLVSLLGYSTDGILRLFGIKEEGGSKVTEEEVAGLMQEGLEAGVFKEAEAEMVESVLELDTLPVKEIMTPRPKIIFISKDEGHESVWHKIVATGHSHFPVFEGNRDAIIGIISVKSIYANLAAGASAKVADLTTPPLIVPESQTVMQLLEVFKKVRKPVALVADEYGSVSGLVTLHDVLQAVVGDVASQHQRLRPEMREREDGSWLIDGLYDVTELEEKLEGATFPDEAGHDYQTLAGFVVSHLSRVPAEAEYFEWSGYRFEIVDMDRHRVDKVLVTKI